MIGRRAFLKRAIAAGVVVSVAPSLLVEKSAIAPAVDPIAVNPFALGGVLQYKDLEEAYQSAMLGRDEPDLIMVRDVRTYRLLKALYGDPRYRPEFCYMRAEESSSVETDCGSSPLANMPRVLWPAPVNHA